MYATLLNFMGDAEVSRKGQGLLKCLIALFMDDKEALLNPQYWDSMSIFLFLGGIEAAKISDPAFNSMCSCFPSSHYIIRKSNHPFTEIN